MATAHPGYMNGYLTGKTMHNVYSTPYFEGYTALPVFIKQERNHRLDASEALRSLEVGRARQLGKELAKYVGDPNDPYTQALIKAEVRKSLREMVKGDTL